MRNLGNVAPNCSTQGLDCTFVCDHLSNGLRDILIQDVLAIHAIVFISRIKLIELADSVIVTESLHTSQTSPQAVGGKNGFEQAGRRNGQLSL